MSLIRLPDSRPDTGAIPAVDGRLNADPVADYKIAGAAHTNSVAGTTTTIAARVRGSAMATLYELTLHTGVAMQLGVFDRLDQLGGLAIPAQ